MYSFFNSSWKKVTEFFAHIDSFFASYNFFWQNRRNHDSGIEGIHKEKDEE